MLRTNRSLTKLDLRGNKIGDNWLEDAGAEAIAAMLRTNRSLTYLELSGNEIGNAGKKALRKAVEGREGFALFI